MKKKIFALIFAIATIISISTIATPTSYAATIVSDDVTVPIVGYQPTFPFNSSVTKYTVGTYFNRTGDDCTCHGTCNEYHKCDCIHYGDGGVQCVAFARYAYDIYYHRKSWSKNGVDENEKDRDISSTENARIEMNKIAVGSYVRVLKSNLKDGHSFILAGFTSSGIMMYDANYVPGGKCLVGYHEVSYSKLASNYAIIDVSISHTFNYTKGIKYNNTLHKVKCTTSDCSGYVLKPHFAETTGTNKTCTICGATGVIVSEGAKSIEDYLASICDDYAYVDGMIS